MQVFLSWSGERSKAVAQLLAEWLPQVVQAAEPFMSTTIDKGRRWSVEIAEKLTVAPVGIICITRENLRSSWLLFEAGAIARPRDGYVCTFLLDVEPADVEPPLGDFQHTTTQKADVYSLVRTINGVLGLRGEKPLSDPVLERVFERNWPELELLLQQIRISNQRPVQRARSDREILDEILAVVRRLRATPETWHEAALAQRFLDSAIERERSRPNQAFVYRVHIVGTITQEVSQVIAAVERLEGLVSCYRVPNEPELVLECVFLRSAEPAILDAVRAVGLIAAVPVARSVTWQDQAQEQPPVASQGVTG
jgi:hypothetical protein